MEMQLGVVDNLSISLESGLTPFGVMVDIVFEPFPMIQPFNHHTVSSGPIVT